MAARWNGLVRLDLRAPKETREKQTNPIEQTRRIGCAAETIEAVVSPAMLFGLATLPLTKVCLQKFGLTEGCMLRLNSWWPEVAGRYGAVESKLNCKYVVPNGRKVGKVDSSDQSLDLHIRLHAHLKHGRLNMCPGIFGWIGGLIPLVRLERKRGRINILE